MRSMFRTSHDSLSAGRSTYVSLSVCPSVQTRFPIRPDSFSAESVLSMIRTEIGELEPM